MGDIYVYRRRGRLGGVSMIDISDRGRNKDLKSKIGSAEEAAAFFKRGMNVACSGFTASA